MRFVVYLFISFHFLHNAIGGSPYDFDPDLPEGERTGYRYFI